MHSTTPSGVRRIWPIVPSTIWKRELSLSRPLSASMVARMYSTVRSNSFSESLETLADLPHDEADDLPLLRNHLPSEVLHAGDALGRPSWSAIRLAHCRRRPPPPATPLRSPRREPCGMLPISICSSVAVRPPHADRRANRADLALPRFDLAVGQGAGLVDRRDQPRVPPGFRPRVGKARLRLAASNMIYPRSKNGGARPLSLASVSGSCGPHSARPVPARPLCG